MRCSFIPRASLVSLKLTDYCDYHYEADPLIRVPQLLIHRFKHPLLASGDVLETYYDLILENLTEYEPVKCVAA